MNNKSTEKCLVISRIIEREITYYNYTIEDVFFVNNIPISKSNINLLNTRAYGNIGAPYLSSIYKSSRLDEQHYVIEAINNNIQSVIDYYTSIKPSKVVHYPDDFKEIDYAENQNENQIKL